MAKSSSLKIAGKYENLTKICDFVTDWAVDAGFDERGVHAVQMAVDEACSNIIEHAYGGEDKGDIYLQCRLLENGLKVTIQDQGAPFDPQTVSPPKIHAPLEERGDGGLGLFLMKQLMDDVTFDFDDRGNTLVMVKNRDAAS
jgi:serine/threonine-protein kinase RsbW